MIKEFYKLSSEIIHPPHCGSIYKGIHILKWLKEVETFAWHILCLFQMCCLLHKQMSLIWLLSQLISTHSFSCSLFFPSLSVSRSFNTIKFHRCASFHWKQVFVLWPELNINKLGWNLTDFNKRTGPVTPRFKLPFAFAYVHTLVH